MRRFVLLCCATALAACGESARERARGPAQESGGDAAAPATSGTGSAASPGGDWTTHRDPSGFSLEIPRGWQVNARAGRIEVAGPGSERLSIAPVRVREPLNPGSGQALLAGLARRESPRQRWNMPPGGWRFGASAVRALGANESPVRELAVLWWVNAGEGASGFFYRAAAEPGRFRTLEPVYGRILSSFRVTRSGAAPRGGDPLAGLTFRRWSDPKEGAFSLEAPVGWHVTGGTFRARAGTGATAQIVLTSPDGRTVVRFGDVNLPTTFLLPTPTLASLGYGEGSRASASVMILRFMSGSDFAAHYVGQTIGRNCAGLRWLRRGEYPDYIRRMAQAGISNFSAHTAGDVSYSCRIAARPAVGYQFSETYATTYQGAGTAWAVRQLFGFTAPPDGVALANAVLQRAIASNQVNPQWYGGEIASQRRTAEMQRRYIESTSGLMQQTYEQRMAVLGRRAEIRGDLLRGQEEIKDPETGRTYKIEAGSNYYWIDPQREVIAGTDQPYKPTWDFREMLRTYE